MEALYSHLALHPVAYVTRERERAQGFADNVLGYSIYSNPEKSTRELIQQFDNPEKSSIVVFKPNRQVEEVCRARNWRLLNPPAHLAEQVEGKVSQVKWLGSLASLLPEHWEGPLAECPWATPFVLQFNWGHSGEGTKLISDNTELGELIKKFPYRFVRVSKFIEGDTYTNNNVVAREKILTGNISLQITGVKELTDNPFATVGNDWEAGANLPAADKRAYMDIAARVGEKLRDDGWRGLFGIDVIHESRTGRMYLLEINARQPASATHESMLQKEGGKSGLTTFEAHIAALLKLDFAGEKLIEIQFGRRTINRRNAN